MLVHQAQRSEDIPDYGRSVIRTRWPHGEDREGSIHQLIIHMVGGWFFLMDGAEEGDPGCCRWVGRSGCSNGRSPGARDESATTIPR